MINLENLKILEFTEKIDEEKIVKLIRQHEHEIWAAEVPVEFVQLKEKEDWKRFFAESADTEYYAEYGNKWAAKYGKKKVAMAVIAQSEYVNRCFDAFTKQMLEYIYRCGITRTEGKKAMKAMLYNFTGAVMVDLLPLECNPFLPLVEVYRLKAMPRRLKDKWMVGWQSSPPPRQERTLLGFKY